MLRFSARRRSPPPGTPLPLDCPLLKQVFAVVDVETTGLDPTLHDIVEVAVIRLTGDGAVRDEYETLVRVEGTPGAEWDHGISSAQLAGAPTLDQAAPAVMQRLADAIVVGHHVAFDLAFLRAGFQRYGVHLPELPHLCTIELADMLDLEEGRHRLGRACRPYGIELSEPHRARSDARATAQLLSAYISAADSQRLTSLRELAEPSRASCESWAIPPLAWQVSGEEDECWRRAGHAHAIAPNPTSASTAAPSTMR